MERTGGDKIWSTEGLMRRRVRDSQEGNTQSHLDHPSRRIIRRILTIGQGAVEFVDPVRKDFRVLAFGKLKVQDLWNHKLQNPEVWNPNALKVWPYVMGLGHMVIHYGRHWKNMGSFQSLKLWELRGRRECSRVFWTTSFDRPFGVDTWSQGMVTWGRSWEP